MCGLRPVYGKIDGGGCTVSEPSEPQPTPPAADPPSRRLNPAAWIVIAAVGGIILVVLGFLLLRPTAAPKPAATPTVDSSRASLAARILASGPAPWLSPTPGPAATPQAAHVEFPVTPQLVPTSDRAALLQLTATAAPAATPLPGQTIASTATPTPQATPVPWTPVPTPLPPCGDPTLALGSVRFRVQPLARAADGSIAVPPDTSGIAYLVQNTETHSVFALSPTAHNLRLQDSVRVSDQAVITWGDCSTDAYEIQAVETSVPALASLLNQSTGGLTAFVEAGAPGQGVLVKAGPPGAGATPEPGGEGGAQADVLADDPVFSADGQSVTLGVTITNWGSASIAITLGDVSLILEDDSSVAPTDTEPALPLTIQPGASATLRSSFPKPPGSSATLKILDLTVPYYF
jgi:hypothetical protein